MYWVVKSPVNTLTKNLAENTAISVSRLGPVKQKFYIGAKTWKDMVRILLIHFIRKIAILLCRFANFVSCFSGYDGFGDVMQPAARQALPQHGSKLIKQDLDSSLASIVGNLNINGPGQHLKK
jgi:hypothetical protein